MDTIQSILANSNYLSFRNIFKLPKEEVYKLVHHPQASVRLAAVINAPVEDVPLFISDPDPDVRDKVAIRLKTDPQVLSEDPDLVASL